MSKVLMAGLYMIATIAAIVARDEFEQLLRPVLI